MNLETFKSTVTAALPIGDTEAIVNETSWARCYVALNRSVLGTLRIQCLDWEGQEWRVSKLYRCGTPETTGTGETLEQALESLNTRLRLRDEAWTESLNRVE